jgi:hypothetical protein
LLTSVRGTLRRKHYSLRTEASYLSWIRRFIVFHGKRHPREMGSPEIESFLTHLAVQGKVAAGTQNQALSAILFLYRQVLNIEVELPIRSIRARRSHRLPPAPHGVDDQAQELRLLVLGQLAFRRFFIFGGLIRFGQHVDGSRG